MKRAPRSRQRHDLYAKYHDYDSEISDLLGECGIMLADIEDNYGNGIFNIGKKLFLTAHKNCKLYDHSNEIKPSDVVAEATRGESISIEQRLTKLRELRDLEIISQEEYTLQRSKIISEI